jgi:hypothetical protein
MFKVLGLPHRRRLTLPSYQITTHTCGESLIYLSSFLFHYGVLVHTSWKLALWMFFLVLVDDS